MELRRIHDYLWEIPQSGAMRVPGRIYASAAMIAHLRDDPALLESLVGVAGPGHAP